MAVAGSLTYDTEIDKTGFNKGINSLTNSVKNGGTKIKNIVAALGITKIIGKALSTINNSMEGAISRIDILNNFPKVMKNLGISSNDSTKAVKKLSEGLKGIPTKLDDASLAVQRFTSINNDVNKSTDYFLAFNNALLAGGASADIQANALEQLSQMYAVGTVDAQAWRSVQTAMPAQLQQVAKSLGYTSTAVGGDFYNAMKSGKISMEQFMQQIVKLNKEGIGQYSSFAEQAKSATGGIQTSISNAKTAIVRGVGNIISAVDEGLKKTDLKGIGNIISNIGSISEKVLKKIANEISKIDFNQIINTAKRLADIYGPKIKRIFSEIINLFKNMLSWASKNKGILESTVGVVISLTGAMKTYKGIMMAIKGIDIAKNIVSTINPVAMLISLTLGLGAAAATVATAMAKQKTSLDGVKDAAELQQKSWGALKEARENSLANSANEISTIQNLADELKLITDENGKVKEGYEDRAQYILGELNTALGTEYKMNGNIISQYGELKDNIDQLITKKKAEAALEAYKEEYQTAIKNQSEATKTLTELRQKYNDELNKTTNGYKEEMEKSRNLAYIGEQIKKQSNLIGEYGYTVEKYENLTTASVSNSKEEIEKALSDMSVSYDQAKNKTNSSLTEQINAQNNYVSLLKQSWQDATDNHDSFQANIIKKQMDTEEQSLINLAESLGKQTSTVNELTEEQKDVWKNLAETSGEAYKKGLSTLPEGTREKVEEATGVVVYDSGLEEATKNKANNTTITFGQNLQISDETKKNIERASWNLESDQMVANGAKTLANNANSGFNNNVDGNKWGTDLSSNISNGMTSQKSQNGIIEAASSIAGWIKKIIGHSVPAAGPLKDELTYMPDMINNLVNGIEKNKYKVANATNKMAQEMKSSFELDSMNDEIVNKMNRAVNVETGRISANAIVRSNANYNQAIYLNANFDGSVDIDGKKAGRILAPAVCKTIKAGGLA